MPTTTYAQQAFPNAAGHGKDSIGGRGGEVVIVNTTADVVNSSDNFISLREAIEVETGPRIITFAVGGLFDMGRDVLRLHNDAHITIAGQTAPSPGVIIKSSGMEIKNSHDIIIRHLTFRNIDPGGGLANNSDCVTIRATASDTYNLMMDHISCSWATDNGLSAYMSTSNMAGLAIRDVSLTNSIVAEGDADSQHDESEAGLPERYLHAMGWNINSITMDSEIRDISVVRNMFAHNARRNPRCTANTSCNIINNIVYNWVSVGSQVSHSSWNGDNHVNIINNLYKKGPSWSPGDCGTNTITLADHAICGDTGTNNHHHIEGNRTIPYPQTGPLPGNSSLIETIENTPSIPIESTIESIESLANLNGEHLRCIGNSRPVRDEIDERIINEFINGTGRAGIADNHVRDYSIYPSNQTTHSAGFEDTDSDGMPDAWETKYGLSVGTNDSTQRILERGFTNIEVYLNAMAACPTLDIIFPQADQVVDGSTGTSTISFDTTWETWTDGPSIHYAINGVDQGIYQPGETAILEDLPEGQHELSLTLMNADGTQAGISDTVSFFYAVDSPSSPNPTAQPNPTATTLPPVLTATVQPTSTTLPTATPVAPADQDDARVADGLSALYTFSEQSGTTIQDRSGHSNELPLTIGDMDAVTWQENSLVVHSPVQISSGVPSAKLYSQCSESNEITIESWITPATEEQEGPARIVSMSIDPFLRNFMLGQDLNTAGSPLYHTRLKTTEQDENGKPAFVTSPNSVSASQTHIVYVRDANGNTSIYLDGELASRKTIDGTFDWNPDYPLLLASEADGSRHWLGEYHLVAIYCRALTPGEVSQNHLYGANYDEPPSECATRANLVENAEFSNRLNSWVTSSGGEGFPRIVNGPTGNALQFSIEDTGPRTSIQQHGFEIQAGKRYEIGFRARSAKGGNISGFVIRHEGDKYLNYGFFEEFDIAHSWTDYSATFTATNLNGTTSNSRLMFKFLASDTYQIDNIRLINLDDPCPINETPMPQITPINETPMPGTPPPPSETLEPAPILTSMPGSSTPVSTPSSMPRSTEMPTSTPTPGETQDPGLPTEQDDLFLPYVTSE